MNVSLLMAMCTWSQSVRTSFFRASAHSRDTRRSFPSLYIHGRTDSKKKERRPCVYSSATSDVSTCRVPLCNFTNIIYEYVFSDLYTVIFIMALMVINFELIINRRWIIANHQPYIQLLYMIPSQQPIQAVDVSSSE